MSKMAKYLLAQKQNMSYHFSYLDPHFRSLFNVVESNHSSGNPDKKSDSKSQFIFANPDKELEDELKALGFEIVRTSDKLMKIK